MYMCDNHFGQWRIVRDHMQICFVRLDKKCTIRPHRTVDPLICCEIQQGSHSRRRQCVVQTRQMQRGTVI